MLPIKVARAASGRRTETAGIVGAADGATVVSRSTDECDVRDTLDNEDDDDGDDDEFHSEALVEWPNARRTLKLLCTGGAADKATELCTNKGGRNWQNDG